MKYGLSLVIWKDIQGHDGAWIDMDDISEYEPVLVHTVGWIITEDEDFITMVSSLSDDQSFAGNVNSIPKGCVRSVSAVTMRELTDNQTEKSESL